MNFERTIRDRRHYRELCHEYKWLKNQMNRTKTLLSQDPDNEDLLWNYHVLRNTFNEVSNEISDLCLNWKWTDEQHNREMLEDTDFKSWIEDKSIPIPDYAT